MQEEGGLALHTCTEEVGFKGGEKHYHVNPPSRKLRFCGQTDVSHTPTIGSLFCFLGLDL